MWVFACWQRCVSPPLAEAPPTFSPHFFFRLCKHRGGCLGLSQKGCLRKGGGHCTMWSGVPVRRVGLKGCGYHLFCHPRASLAFISVPNGRFVRILAADCWYVTVGGWVGGQLTRVPQPGALSERSALQITLYVTHTQAPGTGSHWAYLYMRAYRYVYIHTEHKSGFTETPIFQFYFKNSQLFQTEKSILT